MHLNYLLWLKGKKIGFFFGKGNFSATLNEIYLLFYFMSFQLNKLSFQGNFHFVFCLLIVQKCYLKIRK